MPIQDRSRFEATIRQFDEANEVDPNREEFEGKQHPKELLYAHRMTQWLNRLYPAASEALQLAVRAQHICRWEIPRNDFPDGRVGYLQWRNELKQFHADKAEAILEAQGYEEDLIGRVRFLMLKKQLRQDQETQALEDVICQVFLQFYFPDFASQHTEEKVVSILQKTWRKMSPAGQKAAQGLDYPTHARQLLQKALAD